MVEDFWYNLSEVGTKRDLSKLHDEEVMTPMSFGRFNEAGHSVNPYEFPVRIARLALRHFRVGRHKSNASVRIRGGASQWSQLHR